MTEYVDLSERVTATFYSDEYEEWTQQTVTIADVLDSVCEDYTVLPSAQPEVVKDTIVPCKDTISRQAAIAAVHKDYDTILDFKSDGHTVADSFEDIINALPPAQPEIIRCKDCKHRDPEDKKCDCGHDILWQLPRQDDWYCADAERRTDEPNKQTD